MQQWKNRLGCAVDIRSTVAGIVLLLPYGLRPSLNQIVTMTGS